MAEVLVNEEEGRMVRLGLGKEVPISAQSIVLEDGSRVSAMVGKDGDYIDNYEGVRTMYEAFQRGVQLAGDGPCLGTRTGPNLEYEWVTYNDALRRSRHFGCGLLENGLKPKDLLGIFSRNCAEYVIAQQACNLFSMATVTLYDTLGNEGILHILEEGDLSVVVCGADKLELLLSLVKQLDKLRLIVKIGEVTEDEKAQAALVKIDLVSFAEVEKYGEQNPHEEQLPCPDDLFIVCYTSGTTGKPKGVMLTHGNMAAQLAGMIYQLQAHDPSLGSSSVHLSFLPLAHMMEQTVHAIVWVHGAQIGFSRGDPKLLLDDLQTLRPTFFPTVPRLLNRIYDRILNGVRQAGFIKRFLFNWAMSWKQAYLEDGITRQDTFFDWLVFSKIRALLGGRVTLIVTGAAPVSNEVLTFWRCVFGCPVVEGYGQSECVAGSNITVAGDTRAGHVGPPLCSIRMKLESVPELNYFTENNEGEVCFRGPSVFKGYLKNPEKTKEALDEDGWLHSGDIGRWNADGTLTIFDRKKHIFKLAQGEYLAPERIENICMRAPLVGQVYVYGDSLQTWCVAIVAPDEEAMHHWAEGKGLLADLVQVCKEEIARQAVLEQITEVCKEGGLKSFEQPKAVYLHPEQFSSENGLLTPTLKKKRPQLRAYFQDQLDELYRQLASGQK